jgi:transcriptional regulator with XRE-family HTH domain
MRRMTQADLAGSDFSKGFISLVECGRTRMSLRAAGILAARLDVSLGALLGETSPRIRASRPR